MDRLVMDLVKEGKDINEIMSMPFHYLLGMLEERNKPKEKKSLIAAFGGGSPVKERR